MSDDNAIEVAESDVHRQSHDRSHPADTVTANLDESTASHLVDSTSCVEVTTKPSKYKS